MSKKTTFIEKFNLASGSVAMVFAGAAFFLAGDMASDIIQNYAPSDAAADNPFDRLSDALFRMQIALACTTGCAGFLGLNLGLNRIGAAVESITNRLEGNNQNIQTKHDDNTTVVSPKLKPLR